MRVGVGVSAGAFVALVRMIGFKEGSNLSDLDRPVWPMVAAST